MTFQPTLTTGARVVCPPAATVARNLHELGRMLTSSGENLHTVTLCFLPYSKISANILQCISPILIDFSGLDVVLIYLEFSRLVL